MTGMTEGAVRELANAFFDAYEAKRVDLLDQLYSDDCIIWHNVFGKDTTREENLEAMRNDTGQRRRTYDERTIDAFPDGFVIQYTLNGVMHSGHRGSMPICIVGRVSGGKITRIDEYMDSSKFAAWAGRAGGDTAGRAGGDTAGRAGRDTAGREER